MGPVINIRSCSPLHKQESGYDPRIEHVGEGTVAQVVHQAGHGYISDVLFSDCVFEAVLGEAAGLAIFNLLKKLHLLLR